MTLLPGAPGPSALDLCSALTLIFPWIKHRCRVAAPSPASQHPERREHAGNVNQPWKHSWKQELGSA